MLSGDSPMNDKPSMLGSAARWTRFALLAGIAIVLGLIVTTPRNEYPLTMSRAQANILAAAPGFLMTTLGATNAERFFLVETNKQVICTYNVNGDKLRLDTARRFDVDSDIKDGSTPLKGIKVEGGNGISREEAKIYLDEFNAQMQKLEASAKSKIK